MAFIAAETEMCMEGTQGYRQCNPDMNTRVKRSGTVPTLINFFLNLLQALVLCWVLTLICCTFCLVPSSLLVFSLEVLQLTHAKRARSK